MSFVHLHTHSHYSFLTGLGWPKKIVKKAKELGMKALALTDAGNLYGAFEFYKYCKEAEIKAIIGLEATIARKGRGNKDKDNDLYQIVLLAKNFEGYQNLIQMVTESYLTWFYFKPRIDFELLEKYGNNLIALSGNHTGEISQHITTGKSEEFIRERIAYYEGIVGADSFFLEIQEHPDRGAQGKINDYFINLSKKYGYRVVATNDVFYPATEDAETQDIFFCIGDGRPLEDPDRPTLIEGNYSLRPDAEMTELFAHFPEAAANTELIASMTDLKIPYGQTLIPTFELDEELHKKYEEYMSRLPEGFKKLDQEEWNLRRVCFEGLNYRFQFGLDEKTIEEFIHKLDQPKPEKKLSDMSLGELNDRSLSYQSEAKKAIIAEYDEQKKTIVERIEYELTVVDLMGFNGYFNIVSDFITWAKNNGVPVGPGRGSAAWALLAYLSGITDIDPLPYGLLFERFLNPSRVSMPDIDVDFSDAWREKVLEYVRGKYGADHVAQICTFGTMAARAAVKDAGKVLWIPFSEMNKLAQLIPSKPGTKLHDALEESIEFRQAIDRDERYKKVVDNALKLEGSIRQLWVHACAVIIAPRPMTDYCPLQHPPKDTTTTVTQFSAKPLEDLGLLKMDFLGLRNLTIIERCLKIIKNVHGKDIDMLKINYEDKRVFKVFAEGDTTGVFQFESAGMRKYLRELKPNKFEDIIAMVALYRPGPMAFIPVYIARKHGREKVSYMMDELRDVLQTKYGKEVIKEETMKLERDLGPYLWVSYGIAVYQEQLMQLSQSMGGFSLGEADVLRRWVGKKIREVVEKIKIDFVKKAAETNGYKPETSEFIYEKMVMPAADYSFNKSHAACYSMIAYQTAFLKAYYPTEFMTAVMVSDEEDTERITMEIEECKAKGIEILPPDVNESMKHFTYIDPTHIRFGLKAVKGLGNSPIEAIRKGREEKPFQTILDFISNTSGDVINRKSLEALALSGALDRFGERASMLASIPKIIAYSKEHEKKNETSQMGFFDFGHEAFESLKFELEKAKPMSYEERMKGEKLSIGYPVSGHALDGMKAYIDKRTVGKEHVIAFKKQLAEHESFVPEDEGVHPDVNTNEIVPEIAQNTPIKDDVPVIEETEETRGNGKVKTEKKERDPRVKFMGVVGEVRKVQTKTGKMMAIASCDSFDFRFSIVIFPKDYDTLSPFLEEDKIVMVEWSFKGSLENEEISVVANSLRTNTITAVREQAVEMGLFDPSQKASFYDSEGGADSEIVVKSEIWTLKLPKTASRQDLLDIKEFLLSKERGNIRIELLVWTQKIDTKLTLKETAEFESWAKQRWN